MRAHTPVFGSILSSNVNWLLEFDGQYHPQYMALDFGIPVVRYRTGQEVPSTSEGQRVNRQIRYLFIVDGRAWAWFNDEGIVFVFVNFVCKFNLFMA